MAEPQVIRPSYHGRVTYDQNRTHDGRDYFRSRRQRPHVLRIAHVFDELPPPTKTKTKTKRRPGLTRVKKLIAGSDPAKRLIRLVNSSPPLQELTSATPEARTSPVSSPSSETNSASQFAAPGAISPSTSPGQATNMVRMASVEGPVMPSPHSSRLDLLRAPPRPGGADSIRTDSSASITSSNTSTASDYGSFDNQKAIAHGNGISMFVSLAEPVIYLCGYDSEQTHNTAMLRGNLLLRVTKTAKIKTVSMKFRGRAETDWPEGIPPKRAEFKDTHNIIDHTFSFYDCNMGNSEHHGAHSYVPARGPVEQTSENNPSAVAHGFEQFRKSGVFESITSREGRRMSLQNNHIKSFGKADAGPNPSHKGYRTFTPGDYLYPFELPIASRYPETIDVELGRCKYELEATVERAGAFRTNLLGVKEVQLIRAPSGDSLESVEPIAISRDWEDQLHYDIVISGKSFPIGSTVPIAFKLTPLAKVQCHRLKVFLTETIQYYTKDKKVHRMEPTKKYQLFEKRSDQLSTSAYPGSTIKIISGGGVSYDDRERAARGDEDISRDHTNLLGRLDDEYSVGPTEMELNVKLPSCHNQPEKDKGSRIHFDTSYGNIQVNHWIKIVMRLSKVDPENPGKRRHFEISIDSPLNILSCRSTQATLSLPSYTATDTTALPVGQPTCGCPGAPTIQPQIRSMSGISLNRNPGSASPAASTQDLAASIAPPPAAHLAGTPAQPSPASSTDSLPPVATGAPYDRTRDNNRPIHLLRQPSFNPPAFDDSDPPPPLVTPPPMYESQFGSGDDQSGLADYFQRLADTIDESDDGRQWANRLEIPLTPGGRVNRSMDEVRGWQSLAPGAS